MTPILEGLDGVQKMSKSLGNAIGINDAPGEMYGKLMSISDTLMWSYWTLLTDLRQSEITQMQADVAAGTLHPMEAKKHLAQTITTDFHGNELATHAAESWSKQFQKKETPRDVEAITVALADLDPLPLGLNSEPMAVKVKLAKLVVRIGLAESGSDAVRKIKAGAVEIQGKDRGVLELILSGSKESFPIRVGKHRRIIHIEP